MTIETPTPPDADVSPQPAPTEPDAAQVQAGQIVQVSTSRTVRILWTTGGGAAVGLGSVGIVVPGLPTTGFFILAAWCFSHSSPRFERWVLDLPHIGPMVRDHRDGLGMSKRAKGYAIGTMVLVSALSVGLAVRHAVVGAIIAAAVVVGIWYILTRVPTREDVLASRGVADG